MLMQVTPPGSPKTKYQWYKWAKQKLKYDYDWATALTKNRCVVAAVAGTRDQQYLSQFVNLYDHFQGESMYAVSQSGKFYRLFLLSAVAKAQKAITQACKSCCGAQGVSSRFQNMAR